MHRTTRTCLTTVVGGLVAAGLAATAPAATAASARAEDDAGHHHARHDHDHAEDARVVRLRDDCDPVTFDAALGKGACVGDGDTTFQELFDSLVAGDPDHHWRIQPRRTTVHQGRALRVVNRGGEFHTFTEVPAFGAGCVPELNDLLGLDGPPVADCAAAFGDPQTALPPGAEGTVDTGSLAEGTHYFECMVHPWMTAKVVVRDADDD